MDPLAPQPEPPERLRGLPSWLINQAGLRGTQLVGEALADAGFRRHHFTVLTTLNESGPASQAELGRRLGLDRSDMHAIVNELEAKALISRERDEKDRRRNVVQLSPAGRQTLTDLDARVNAAQHALLAPLDRHDRTELVRLLRALNAGS